MRVYVHGAGYRTVRVARSRCVLTALSIPGADSALKGLYETIAAIRDSLEVALCSRPLMVCLSDMRDGVSGSALLEGLPEDLLKHLSGDGSMRCLHLPELFAPRESCYATDRRQVLFLLLLY